MNETEIDNHSSLFTEKAAKPRRFYQVPHLIILETADIQTGGTNAPEATNGQLS